MAQGIFNLKQVNQAIRQRAWTGTYAPTFVEYLVVAGGGGGASEAGGGAGGLLTGIVPVTAGASYTVTVGSGGAAATAGVNSVFGNITANGGGNATNSGGPGVSGGSGGGAGSTARNTQGRGVVGQGNAGGGGGGGGFNAAGGGGGAGTVGGSGLSGAPTGGNGGNGIASQITGSTVVYAGGGGGSMSGGTLHGSGGVGGGGAGGASSAGKAGTVNTGGGGGGSWGGSGASGGSGIVIVRYPGTVQFYTGGTVNYANGYIVHTFYANGTLAPTTPTQYSNTYQISRSLRFNSADTAYLNRTPSVTSNRRTWTWSGWIKKSSSNVCALFTANTSAPGVVYLWLGGDTLEFTEYVGGYNFRCMASNSLSDPSAWYHIVASVDTTEANASDRIKLYLNGTRMTLGIANDQPSRNYETICNSSSGNHQMGRRSYSGTDSAYFTGYMTDVHLIDGQALTPSSFGEYDVNTGVWIPRSYGGSYGTNGFKLNFSNNTNTTAATLGADSSGNGNNWTPNNFSVTAGAGNDSLVDSPTSYGTDTGVGGSVRGNYCTFNPIGNGSGTLTNGNLDLTTTSTYADAGTLGLTSGKWYWEVTLQTSSNPRVGVYDVGSERPSAAEFGASAFGWCIINSPSRVFNNNSAPNYGAFTPVNGTVVMLAYDADNGRLWYGQDGTWFASGNPATNANPSQTGVTGKAIVPACSSGSGSNLMSINAGQRAFAYTAPSGFKALCTTNLPTPTIGATATTRANKYFDATLYTGTGSTLAVTNSGGFQPDWVWLKNRSNTAYHSIWDAVRGRSAGGLASNDTGAEQASTAGNDFVSFNSNGFSVGPGQNWNVNTSGNTYVGWQWKAGGAGVTNTSGSITSSVSASPASGFSIVSFNSTSATGTATIGHGLGAVPSMIIMKNRAYYNWEIYHISSTSTSGRLLFTTSAKLTDANPWNQSAQPVTSSIFGYDQTWNNGSNDNIIAYCFAPIAGYSAFGSYTGNASTDGPFVFTGFRPAYVMIKRSDSTDGGEWKMHDTIRTPFNWTCNVLFAQASDAENTTENQATYGVDMVSNGFKIRASHSSHNASGGTYIYMAFASNPFKYSLAR